MPKMWQKWFDALKNQGVDRLGGVRPIGVGQAPSSVTPPIEIQSNIPRARQVSPSFHTESALRGLMSFGGRR